MPGLPLPIHRARRLVPVTFRRATTGAPMAERPDLDERGFGGPERGPLVAVCQNERIIVEVVRQHLKSDAPLFATSSAPGVAAVDGAAQLGPGAVTQVKVRGVAGGNPATARIQIRYGSAGGPVLAQLGVWVYRPITLRIKPHLVKITTAANAAAVPPVPPVAPTRRPEEVLTGVQSIWKPFGINFTLLSTVEHTFQTAIAGAATWGPDIGNLFATFNPPAAPAGGGPAPAALPKTIHVYFAHHVLGTAGEGYFGLGIAPGQVAAHAYDAAGITTPGIIVADEARGAYALDNQLQSAMLAHEIGHFLMLWHPEKQDAGHQRQDLWSRRMLMYPTIPPTTFGNWLDKLGYGTFRIPAPWNKDAPRNGALITMKDLSQLITDGEATTARTAADAF
ncbi:MAG: hypothetical protein QM767_20655 [Anaeromyxobacter sp.]